MSTGQPKAAGAQNAAAQAPSEPEGPVVPQQAPGTVPMGQRGAIYTMTAREGVNAAELVNAALARKSVGKTTPRRVEVAPPDGPSTDGGKRARQAIRLVPVSGTGGQVMIGVLDVGQKIAELRHYATVGQQFKERFGMGLDFTPDEYDTLMKDLQATFGVFQYKVELEHAPPAGSPAMAARVMKPQLASKGEEQEERSPVLSMAIVLIALAALAGVGFAIFGR